MISANTVPATLSRLVDSLPLTTFDLNRLFRARSLRDGALKNAYAQFCTSYAELVEQGFDQRFLATHAPAVLKEYGAGRIDRREVAIALATAWGEESAQAVWINRGERLAGVAKAAGSLLEWYDAERAGELMVVTPPVVADRTASVVAISEVNFALTVHLDENAADSAEIVATGVLDGKSYEAYLSQVLKLYQMGIRRLTVDLGNVSEVNLSGIFALHATAKIFSGESYPDSEYGLAGLRHMAEENLAAGPSDRVRLVAVHPAIAARLEQVGVVTALGA